MRAFMGTPMGPSKPHMTIIKELIAAYTYTNLFCPSPRERSHYRDQSPPDAAVRYKV